MMSEWEEVLFVLSDDLAVVCNLQIPECIEREVLFSGFLVFLFLHVSAADWRRGGFVTLLSFDGCLTAIAS